MKSKPIKGFSNYLIFENGAVFSIPRRDSCDRKVGGYFLKNKTDTQGYFQYSLSKNNKCYYKRTHCLVAEHFLGPRPSGFEVNHKDRDKTNNHWSNLEYVTPRENINHREKQTKKRWGVFKVNSKRGIFWIAKIRIKGKQVNLGRSRIGPEHLWNLYREKYKELYGVFPW